MLGSTCSIYLHCPARDMITCTLNVLIAAKDCNVYYPGAGVGGYCLPVDSYYLIAKAEELGYQSKVITAGRAVKNSKSGVMGFVYRGGSGVRRKFDEEKAKRKGF